MASVRKPAGLSWREMISAVFHRAMADDVVNRAAALSFWFLLGFFPLLFSVAGMVSMIGGSQGTHGILMEYMGKVLPSSASTLVRQVLSQTTGRGVGLSLLFALWSASSASAGLMDALNGTYDLKESRPWWKARLLSVVLAAATGVLLTVALMLVVYIPIVLRTIAPGSALILMWRVAQWPLAACLLFLALLCVYRFAPDVKEQKWKWLVPGSVLALVIWLAVSFGFKVYIRHFSNYGMLYGSVGTLIILMFWFYLSGAAILIGGELNAILEDAAAQRHVAGAKPRGHRSLNEAGAA